MPMENTAPQNGTEHARNFQQAQPGGAEDAFLNLLGGAEDGEAPQDGEEDVHEAPDLEDEGQEQDDEPAEEAEAADSGDEEAEAEDEDNRESKWDANEVPDDLEFDVHGTPVTLHELKRGFLREADYTRKTQALAESRKAAEAETMALRAERAQAAQLVMQAQQLIKATAPQEPDWQKLYAENPQEYATQREIWRSWKEQVASLNAQQQRAAQQANAAQQRQLQQQLQQEQQRLLDAIPSWKDAKVADAEKQRIIRWGQAQGYSSDELGSIVDHRALVVARKAMLYDELMAKRGKAKGKQAGGRVAAPSQRHNHNRADSRVRSRKRLAKTGRVEDAAAVFFDALSGEK